MQIRRSIAVDDPVVGLRIATLLADHLEEVVHVLGCLAVRASVRVVVAAARVEEVIDLDGRYGLWPHDRLLHVAAKDANDEHTLA